MFEQIADFISRAGALDPRNPRHDPLRAKAAYKRRLERASLRRSIWWVTDPDLVDRATLDMQRNRKALAFSRNPDAIKEEDARVGEDNPIASLLAWAPWFLLQQDERIRQPDGTFHLTREAWARAAGWPALAGVQGRPKAIRAENAAFWDCGIAREIDRVLGGSLASDLALTIPLATEKAYRHDIRGTIPPPAGRARLARAAAQFETRSAFSFWTQCFATAAWDSTAAWDAGIAIACLNLPFADDLIDRAVDVYAPMIEAVEAGAFAHALFDRDVFVLAAPQIWMRNNRLHREDGPALAWPRTKIYAWDGVIVPEDVILDPQTITTERIEAETDPDMRSAMAEIRGWCHA